MRFDTRKAPPRFGGARGRYSAGIRASRMAALLLPILLAGNMPAFARGCTQDEDAPRSNYLGIGGGKGDVLRGSNFGYGAVLYRSHRSWHDIHPGAMLGFAGPAHYVSLTLTYGCRLSERLDIALTSGPGLYERSGWAPNLGSPVEFLSTLELSWRVYRRQRLAVAFGHMSNGHLNTYNPGSELLEVLYMVPVR